LEPILIIIGVNLFVFVAVNIRPELIYSLGLVPYDILSQPWQVVTCMFTHYDFLHLFSNMYTLYFFGSSVLQLLGQKKFWLIYMVGGIMGSFFYLWLGQPSSVAIGASGAIFALGGALAVLRPNMKVFIFPIPVAMPLWAAILGGFVLLSFVSNVAWQAHLGGMLFGLAAGYYYRRKGYQNIYYN
jgi:membrane associated rhomboid family serine protease